MMLSVPRRVSMSDSTTQVVGALLSDQRDFDAYVLLGDPGAGKTEAFQVEASAAGAVYLTARDFITIEITATETGKTLFIDGLDEMRAASTDINAPLDLIRARLQALGNPRFRLSCREYDWRSQTDLAAIGRVAPGGVVHELHLDPLSRSDQLQLVQANHDEIHNPVAFMDRADELGISNLFGNPLLLTLTIRAVAQEGRWPESRREIYDLACRNLALERSIAHNAVNPIRPGDVDHLLDDAGLLCALLLLSGKVAFTGAIDTETTAIPMHTLPSTLLFWNADFTLSSKIFVTLGGVSAPRHRSIAEYLSGKAITRRLQENGLPLTRILALTQGGDGSFVEPLRGLIGWLATHCARDRELLTSADPMAVILNGDIGAFSRGEKKTLLASLRDEARRNPWFRNRQWVSYPFAPLATSDMADESAVVLKEHSQEASHQALVECVLDALEHGPGLQQLGRLLEDWIEDRSANFGNRLAALRVWARANFDPAIALAWLVKLHEGSLEDKDARLASELLMSLYPQHIGAAEVLNFWPKKTSISPHTVGPSFWRDRLIQKTNALEFPVLARAWLAKAPAALRPNHDETWMRLQAEILAGALEESGDNATDVELYDWLAIGVDVYGFSKVNKEPAGKRITDWLVQRPDRMKSVMVVGWDRTALDAGSGQRHFWQAEQRLHGAQLPRDWPSFLLRQAAETDNEALAKWCFGQVVHTMVDPPAIFDLPTIQQIEEWVGKNEQKWPGSQEWLRSAWTSQLADNWKGEHHRHQRESETRNSMESERRRLVFMPYLEALATGSALPQVMADLAGAYEGNFSDIEGDTAEARIQHLLGCDVATAMRSIAGLAFVLRRKDLPSADDIFRSDEAGKYYHLRGPALLAARLAYESDPSVLSAWPERLLAALTAFWLTYGVGERPKWFDAAVESYPAVVAPLLVRRASRRLRLRKQPISVPELWALSHEPGHAALARLVVPILLQGFPQRASPSARRELNGSLLPALSLLDDARAMDIVERKLANPSLDKAQRICWLVAQLPYKSDVALAIADAASGRQQKVEQVGIALNEQEVIERSGHRLSSATLASLIETLAPLTNPGRPLDAYWVGPSHNRISTVEGLLKIMASDSSREAGSQLQRLVRHPGLARWTGYVQYSAVTQQAVAREAQYVHANPVAVARVLANREPANQADLKALAIDHLIDLELHLRGSDTYSLRLYWTNGSKQGTRPRVENDCRDLLVEHLRPRLRWLGVHVVPERLAADDKRADMRVDYIGDGGPLALPIEVKKEDHPNVWDAWQEQLQRLYTIDPAADGHGVYLVLWFGFKPRKTPDGIFPSSAAEFTRLLRERVPEKDRRRLAICVLDLSLT